MNNDNLPKEDIRVGTIPGYSAEDMVSRAMANAAEEMGEDLLEIEQQLGGEPQPEPPTKPHFVEDLEERRRWVIGVYRTLKKHNIGPNHICPCGSNKKFKKCCRPLLENQHVPIRIVLERLKLRHQNEMIVNQATAALKGL